MPSTPDLAEEGEVQVDGVGLIAAERQRQIEHEGWSKDHDADDHDTGELGLAAAAYALEAVRPARELNRAIWPWDETWWKPKDPIRNLVRAGALIAAEIDRLQADG